MTLLDSLLDAILRLDGEALVMHAGEKPYVVLSTIPLNEFRGPVAWGHVELSSRPLTADAVLSMLAQMLSAEQSRSLDEYGAIEHEIDAPGDSAERFVVTAARGGDDVWVEVRRRVKIVEPLAVAEPPQAPAQTEAEVAAQLEPAAASGPVIAAVEAASPVAADREAEPVLEIVAEAPQDADVHEISAIDADLSGLGDDISQAPVFEIASTPSFTIQTEAARVPDEDEHEAAVFELEADGALLEFAAEPAAAPPVAPAQAARLPIADERVTEIAEQKLAEIAQRKVAELAERKVGEIAARKVAEAAEQHVAEIAGHRVAEVAKQKVGEVAEERVAAAAEQRVAEIAGQKVAEAAELRVAELAAQKVAEAAEQQVAEIAERKVADAAQQQVAELAGLKVDELAERKVVEIAERRIAELAAQKISEIADRKLAEIAEQKVAELAEQKVAELAEQKVAAAAEQRVPAAIEPELEAAPVVVPHVRPTLKLHEPQPASTLDASMEASLVELLRAALVHRASTVYAVVDARPMMRVDGQISAVGTYPAVAHGDVERFIFEFAPRERVSDSTPEWTCTVSGVGRVRCVTFQDHSGSGVIFHLPTGHGDAADDLADPAELASLCGEADGLVVVAGPRWSGKSTLLSAFVDLINRTRYDHVITIESQIRRVHEKRLSFISQREVRGDGDAIAAAARAALREGPDVLVIEDLRAPEALIAALDAARAGRLVLGSISARTAPAAIERLIDGFPAERRPPVRASLAGSLRAVVAQLLVPERGGGRTAAREVLLSSPAVRKLVLDGALEQLPIAIESGRRLGMRTMVDSLCALVRDGQVDVADACASAPDRLALISALERDGIDVTGVERRA